MEQEKKKGKKKGLVIVIILFLLLIAGGVTAVLINQGVFQKKTEITNNIPEAEQTLRERLAAEGSETIEITEDMEIYGGPLIVNGNKKLVGEGALIAMEGFENGALLSVSNGAKLQVEEVELNANLLSAYVLYVAKSGEASIGDGVNISDAAESNIYNEGTFTMTGGRLRKGEVGIRNAGTAVIEDGIVALMNRYLVDNLTEGTLEIKGGNFSSSEGYGIYNRGTMTVANAEISANKLMGICNLGKADVKDSLVSMNSYHNIINKSRATLTIENTEIVASSQSGIHNEEDAYAVVKSCKFNTNTLGNVHNRGEIEIYKCSFEDVGYSSVISDGKVASTYIEDTSISNTTSNGHGLLSTNGCSVELKDVNFVNVTGRAIHNKGGFVTGKNVTVDGTGKVAIGNNAYETGSYGSVKLKNVDVTTPFVSIINDCDGVMEIKDGKLTSTANTTVRIASGTMTLEDVAVTGAQAQGETKFYGVYANGGTLNITDCSIKNTSSRGIQNYGTIMNIDGLLIENTGAAAMGTIAVKEGVQPSIITANNLTITNAGSNSICNAGKTSKIIVTNSVINPAKGNSIKVLEGELTMENTKIYGSQKEECVAVLVNKDGTAYLQNNVYITNENGRGVINEGILQMKDTTVENCKTKSHGGAVYSTGNLKITDSVLYKNTAGANGGAIHAAAVSTMELNNVEMNDNEANGQGGAINLPGGTEENPGNLIKIKDVTIKNNTTSMKSSGAIYVGKYRSLEINGKNTEISRNSAATTGGAIGAGDYANITINAGTISGNEAKHKDGGGAVFLWNAALVMNGGTISENTAKAGDGGAIVGAGTSSKITITGGKISKNEAKGGSGGAIHAVADTTVTLSNVEFSENSANTQGGAINLKGASKEGAGTLTLTDVTIKDNTTSTKSAGAVYVGKYRQLEINGDDTVISGNSAKTTGGAIGTGDYASITMNAGTIRGNEANATDGGGAIFLWNASFVMNGGTISGNTAVAGDGGAIAAGGTLSTITATGGTISNNQAKGGSGGAIHAVADAIVTLSNVELSENSANTQGGAINLKGASEEALGKLTITDVTIKDNTTSTKSAGAVYVGKYRQLEINGDDTIISGNSAKTTGGAIGTGDYAVITMNAGTLSKNEANAADGGGAIFLWNATFVMNGGTINGNIAKKGNGGAVVGAGTSSTITVAGGTMSNNAAQGGSGGAIHAVEATAVNISNVELSGNTANTQGGAISLANGTKAGTEKVTLTDVTIKDNTTSTKSSGAVYVGKYRQLEINGENTVISGNSAKSTGGAIGTSDNASITMNAGTISQNEANAADGGGAIFLWNASFVMNGGTISENTAKAGDGGAIVGASTSSTITVTGGAIRNNIAKGQNGGGGIYLRDKAVITVTGGSIYDNTVKSGLNGENVYINSGTSVKLAENADLRSVYFATGNAPIQVMGNALNNPVTVTCTSADQDGILVVKRAEGSIANLKQLCANNQIIMGAGFDNPSYELIETEQGMAWTQVTTVTTVEALKEAIESTDNALKYIKLSVTEPLSVNEKISVKNNANIILMGNATLTRSNEFTGEFFYVEEGSTLTLEVVSEGNTLTLNGAKNTVVAEKALIYCDGTLNIKEGVILQNNQRSNSTSQNTAYNGGAIYLNDTAVLNMTGGTISGNQSGGHGGAIHVATKAQVNLSNVTLTNNTAIGQGGAINLAGGSATNKGSIIVLENVIIQNNTAKTKSSGAVYVGAYRQLKIDGDNTTISGNNSGTTGGAMTAGSGAVITMNAGTISGNKAKNGGGGAIYLWEATFDMNGGKLQNNTSAAATAKNAQGGAIYASAKSKVDISNAEVSSNSAYRGGAIYLAASTAANKDSLTLTNVIMQSNTTTNSAGAVYAGNYWNVEIDGADTLIRGNSSGSTAGAFTTGTGVNLTMKAGTISGNTAKGGDGAAVYFWQDSKFVMSGGVISGNIDARTNGDSPNVRAHYTVTIQLSGAAQLESVYWQNGVNEIQVTAPLTAENVNTVITMPTYTVGTTVVSHIEATEEDIEGLLSKFSVADGNYTLVSDGNDLKLANK